MPHGEKKKHSQRELVELRVKLSQRKKAELMEKANAPSWFSLQPQQPWTYIWQWKYKSCSMAVDLWGPILQKMEDCNLPKWQISVDEYPGSM